MAQKTDTQLQTYADSNINTNGANAITGAIHNTMLTDMIDSKINVDKIKNHSALAATTAGSFTVPQYHLGKWIIIEYVSGTPVVKLGTTLAGEEIFPETTVSSDVIDNNVFKGSLSIAWTLYYTVSGGSVNIYVRTENFKE